MSGSLNCHTCKTSLSSKITVSDRNGNKGKYYISCSGTEENPHVQFFRFIEDLHPSAPPQTPLHTTDPQPTLMTRTMSQQHVSGEIQGRCAVLGCAKRRVNIKCVRSACATHCRALGGCPVNLHQHDGTISMPSSSQSFETTSALPWSHPPLTTFPVPTPTFPPLRIAASLPLVPVFIPTASSSIDQPISMPDEQLSLYPASPSLMLPREAPTVVSSFPTQIVAEPPSSMNPLPNPRFASQMRPIFTDQSKREQEMRENARVIEEQRLAAIKKVKHTITVCAWLVDGDGPEEFIHQGGFVWPNFCISTAVLAAAGFQTADENAWYHLYNRPRRSWQRFKANHFTPVDLTTTEILIKAVNVKTCARLDEYLTDGMKAAIPPHFRTDLHGERESVKAKLDHRFLQLNPSTLFPPTTPKRKSKQACKIPTAQTLKQPPLPKSRANIQTTPISISSSSPSPFRPQGDITDLTDSESSDIYCTPVKRRKVTVKHERHTSPLASSTIQAEKRQWLSDYPVLDVVHILHSCKPPPSRTTIAQHFYSLTGIPFKSSTYYDAWSRWDEATQEQRDNAEGYSLWKNFAVQVPLKKTKLKVARQRVLRRQHTAETQESDGSVDGELSSDSSSFPTLFN
ncbi:hypothetical protein BYT27DRAFT_7180444 [Phlegmacium glaucopus]|nr:hypothetical protein BYT27DRAFT_7180444 [Phlegmacium glaucopus]